MAKIVTIEKNGKTKSVSYAAYCNFFKDAGWVVEGEKSPSQPVTEKKSKKAEKQVETVVEETESAVEADVNDEEDEIADEEWDEAIAETEVEKPISEMNREELVAKAESLGVKIGNKSNEQLRKAIKEAM